MELPRYQRAAALVRRQVTSGALAPGAAAPSGAELARLTGFSVLTCRRALRSLIMDGTLVAGASRNARPRVPGPGGHGQKLDAARRDLSASLARHRRAAGLTQVQLAEKVGVSVTSIGHAETGRLWQSRALWRHLDEALSAAGDLLRRYDAYRAAQTPPCHPAAPEDTAPHTASTTEPSPATHEAPAPTIFLVLWTDGTITAAPITRVIPHER